MITGFNTDIVYEGVTYHVQTEDKGLDTPMILSLIYDGGTILASKRSPYNDLLENFDEKVLTDRLQRQHKLICAAVKAGRIEDLKRMTMKESATNKTDTDQPIAPPHEFSIVEKEVEKFETNVVKTEKTGFETVIIPQKPLKELPLFDDDSNEIDLFATRIERKVDEIKPSHPSLLNKKLAMEEPELSNNVQGLRAFRERIISIDKSEEIFSEVADPFVRETSKIPKPDDGLIFEVPQVIEEPIIEEVLIVEEEMILPDEAVMIIAENINQPVIVPNGLTITLIDELSLKGGDRKTLNILVHRGKSKIGLSKAHVIIKILGSTFRPIIFHAKTDNNGVAVVHLQLPSFKTGRAVLLIRTLHDGEEAELRRVIDPS